MRLNINKYHFIRNLDFILLVIRVLDPESIDEISSYFLSINKSYTSKIGQLVFSTSISSYYLKKTLNLNDLVLLIIAIFHTVQSIYWIKLLSKILHLYTYPGLEKPLFLSCFLRKYRFYFRQNMDLYRLGIEYDDDIVLNEIAIKSVYFLYTIIQEKDIFLFIEILNAV
nr:hypothetical protein [Erythrocladia irregularis]